MPPAVASAARPAALDRVGRLLPPVAAFVAGAGPVALLGFSRGGYPVEVVAGYGVALTWLVLVGFLTDAIPRPRPNVAGWIVLGAVGALTAWGLASLSWTADRERGLTEVVRMLVAGASLLLGMSAVRSGQARALMGGVFAGLTVIVVASAISRLQPDLIAGANETSDFLGSKTRTSWPLNYWNAVAAGGSIALSLGVVLAARARSTWTAAATAAPLPVIVLGTAFTLSRGGMLAAGVALVAAVLVVAPRPVVVRTLIAPGIGALALVLAAYGSSPIADATGSGAQSSDGRAVLVLAVLVTLGAGLVQAGWAFADRARWTPTFPRPGRRVGAVLVAAIAAGVLLGGVAAGAPDRLSTAWSDFQVPTVQAEGTDRLTSVSSSHRYQIWSGTIDAMSSHPLRGIGLGSWESWWAPRRDGSGFVRNAHSEPFELLAETGLIGGALFLVVLIGPLLTGVTGMFRRRAASTDARLAVPALVAFTVALSVDWNWQIGAIMVAGITVAAVPLSRAWTETPPPMTASARRSRVALVRSIGVPVGTSVIALAAFAVFALALVAPQGVDASRTAAQNGNLAEASKRAAAATEAAGFASSPAMQLALIEEQAGRLPEAARAAKLATKRAPDDWRGWFLVARIAAARGHAKSAVAAFERARALNPDSPLLKP
jgi:hypothetical protein